MRSAAINVDCYHCKHIRSTPSQASIVLTYLAYPTATPASSIDSIKNNCPTHTLTSRRISLLVTKQQECVECRLCTLQRRSKPYYTSRYARIRCWILLTIAGRLAPGSFASDGRPGHGHADKSRGVQPNTYRRCIERYDRFHRERKRQE